jgi:hypothetical protein
MQITRFLKLVLTADALSCLGMGAVLTAAAAPLADLFGLAGGLVSGAGLALLPVGLFILIVARRETVAPIFVYAIIAGNALWIAESLVLAANAPRITIMGTAFVLAQAAIVAFLTAMETTGMMRSRQAPTSRA